MDILVAYDIADTDGPGAARLRQTADVCEKYGERVQLSVFECRLTQERFARLIGELQDVINADLDSVVIYRFAGPIQESRTMLGRPRAHELGEPWVL